MKIIAFVGMPGSGKTTATNFLREKGMNVLRLGDLTDEELKKRHLTRTEENERKIREELREKFGMQAYADYVIRKIKYLEPKPDAVFLDGVRSFEEYSLLKKEFGSSFSVIAIVAGPSVRHARLVSRKERPLTWEQCISRDESEVKKLNHGSTIAMADYYILNENKGKEELGKEITALVDKVLG